MRAKKNPEGKASSMTTTSTISNKKQQISQLPLAMDLDVAVASSLLLQSTRQS
ncbi:hypothetical protein PI124_g20816 [Phytophthora idaei]|nr:hypothetical protein PI125_g15992 [Phytophthora idaei]KAG3234127.1 hypothetical protein PI124_g20816 [Phytophthora idaei]